MCVENNQKTAFVFQALSHIISHSMQKKEEIKQNTKTTRREL